MHICNFCKSDFYDKSTLNRHQRSSKKCKKIQENKKDVLKDKMCIFCKKELSTIYTLQTHLTTCKVKKSKDKNDIVKLRKEMQKMSSELENLKNCSITNTTINVDNSITNNNYGSILNCLTKENVEESFKDFSINDLNQRKLAEMTIKNLLSGKDNPLYLCKDRSRNKFVYTDEDNNEKEDPNAILLRTLVYKGVSPIIQKMYAERAIELHNELARCLRTANTATVLCSRDDIKELDNAYKKIDIIKDGNEYISQLSKTLPSSLEDRKEKDKFQLEVSSDEDIQQYINSQIRMIGNYTISELSKFKIIYLETGILKGPKDIIMDQKWKEEYIQYMNN